MIDNTQLSSYYEKQAAQDSRMAILETKVDDLQKGLEDFNNKDKEELKLDFTIRYSSILVLISFP